jgi:hypothetical protein
LDIFEWHVFASPTYWGDHTAPFDMTQAECCDTVLA